MDNPQASVTEYEMGWLTGILDGEGHVGISPHKNCNVWQVYIKFVNTNILVIDKLQSILNRLGVRYLTYDAWRAGNQRPAKRVEINGLEKVQVFLNRIQKYDFAKKEESLALLKYINLRMGKRKGEQLSPTELTLIELIRSKTKR